MPQAYALKFNIYYLSEDIVLPAEPGEDGRYHVSSLLDRLDLVFYNHRVSARILPDAHRPLHPDRLGLEHYRALGLLDHPQLGQPRPDRPGVRGPAAGTTGDNNGVKSQHGRY